MSLTLAEQAHTLRRASAVVAVRVGYRVLPLPAAHLLDALESTARALQHYADTGQTRIGLHCIVALLIKAVERALREVT